MVQEHQRSLDSPQPQFSSRQRFSLVRRDVAYSCKQLDTGVATGTWLKLFDLPWCTALSSLSLVKGPSTHIGMFADQWPTFEKGRAMSHAPVARHSLHSFR